MLRRSDVKYFEKPDYNLSYLFIFSSLTHLTGLEYKPVQVTQVV